MIAFGKDVCMMICEKEKVTWPGVFLFGGIVNGGAKPTTFFRAIMNFFEGEPVKTYHEKAFPTAL